MRDDHDTARPSPRAVERLADTVGAEVRDLRGALQRALDAADRHEADGREDLAVAVLEEQRELLVLVHQRLQTELAGAAVEREAEAVLAAVDVPAAPAIIEDIEDEADDDAVVVHLADRVPVDNGRAMFGRLLASAAAAVLGIALLTAPDGSGGQLSIAGARSSDPQPGSTTDRADAAADDAQVEARAATTERGVDAERTDVTPPAPADLRPQDESPAAPVGGALAAEAEDEPAPSVHVDGLGIEGPAEGTTIPTIAPDAAGDSSPDTDEADEDEDVDEDGAPKRSDDDEQAGKNEAPAAPDGDGSSKPAEPEGDGPPSPSVGGSIDPPASGAPPAAQPSTLGAVGDGQAASTE